LARYVSKALYCNDENTTPRFRDTLANIIGENEISRARFLSVRADSQQARRFVDDDDVSVFVNKRESARQKLATWPVRIRIMSLALSSSAS
jgi:hypothetical protein